MKKRQARPRKRNARDSRAFRKALADDVVTMEFTEKGMAMIERLDEARRGGASEAEVEALFFAELERAEKAREGTLQRR